MEFYTSRFLKNQETWKHRAHISTQQSWANSAKSAQQPWVPLSSCELLAGSNNPKTLCEILSNHTDPDALRDLKPTQSDVCRGPSRCAQAPPAPEAENMAAGTHVCVLWRSAEARGGLRTRTPDREGLW